MEVSSSDTIELRVNPKYNGIRYPHPSRAITKTGVRNVTLKNIPAKAINFWKDIVTSLIDIQWRYIFIILIVSYFITWTIFACILYWISYAHGDFNYDPITGDRLGKGQYPCIFNVEGFAGFLLTSIDSQTTIGYGHSYPSEECKDTLSVMGTQLIVGIFIEGILIGVFWVKITRPVKRVLEQKFSKKAVICLRDGKLCLVFRVDDPSRNHDIGTKIEAIYLEQKTSDEGELIRKYQQSIALENNGQVTVLWPQTVAHIIDETSPLYDMTSEDLLDRKFEIVVAMTGNSSLFPQISQSRTSYISREIMWGHRFLNIIQFNGDDEVYDVDYESFDKTEVILTTPQCSAKDLIESELNKSDEIENYDEFFEPDDNSVNKILETIEIHETLL